MERKKLDLKVLYVEDDSNTREEVSEMLQRWTTEVFEAENGRQGWEIFKENRPELIISDLRMSVMDGMEMFRAIRELDENIPIIVTSAYSDTDYFLKSIEFGISQYVLKPIDRELFRAAIERCYHQIELGKKVKSQNEKIFKLYQAVEQNPSLIMIIDCYGMVEYINPRFTEVTGYTLEEVKEAPFGFLVELEELSKKLPAVLETIKSGRQWNGEYLAKKKDGVYFWETLTISPLREETGETTNFLAVRQDITANKKIAEDLFKAKNELELRVAERTAELVTANEHLKEEIAKRKQAERTALDTYSQNLKLLSSIQSVVIGVSKEDLIFQWNQAAEKTFGISAASVIGKPLSECGICWNWNQVSHQINDCRGIGESVKLDDILYTRPDGKEGLLGFTINPIGEHPEEKASYFLFGTDITDQKKIEAKNILSQKLESIGRLAAGIAHEINTPIQYVGDNLHFISESFKEMEKLFENYDLLLEAGRKSTSDLGIVEEIEKTIQTIDFLYLRKEIPKAIEQSRKGAARVAKIVRAMKDFSHPSQGVKKPADLNKALENTIIISKNEWKYVTDLETDFDPDLPQVTCVIDEINQVILNMIINAVHAIMEKNPDGGKGKIIIQTRSKTGLIEIRISDTGAGIPPEIINKIFDPFFTTKEVGKGTGQGLTLAHDIIVNKHNGSIEVESEVGKGTTFIILLPVGEAPNK